MDCEHLEVPVLRLVGSPVVEAGRVEGYEDALALLMELFELRSQPAR